MSFYSTTHPRHEWVRECLINGQRQVYDACSSRTLAEAEDYYVPLGFKYIGSSNTYFINGTENTSKDILHFFIKLI